MGNHYLNNDKIATIILNPTPSRTENYLWIPEGISDNVVPGLDHIFNLDSIKTCDISSITESYSQHK